LIGLWQANLEPFFHECCSMMEAVGGVSIRVQHTLRKLVGEADADNCAYLREKYDATIAMHFMAGSVSKSDRSQPDLSIEDGYDLSEYGFDAKVLSIPGHSKGSIGILTAGGDLFCGDLLINVDKPVLNDIIDYSAAANVSVERLKSLNIHTVYPGHGKPCPMEQFITNN